MNLRCAFCQTPYTLGRIEKLDALQHMDANKLSHYDAHCPRCRKATPIPRQRLEMTMPNWREALKELEKEMAEHPQKEAPLPKLEAAPVSQTESKPESVPAPAPAPVEEKKPATKAKASKPKAEAKVEPVEKAKRTKPAAKAKTTAKKSK